MKYSEFKVLVMQHLDQYGVAGVTVPESYNNQADDTARICALTNIALRTIASRTKPLLASLDPNAAGITCTEDLGNGWTKIKMPADFLRMSGQGLPRLSPDGSYDRNMHYRYLSNNEIVVRTEELPGLIITYYRLPRKVQGYENEELDASEMAAECASFYVAAQLARTESAYAYQTLYNEFETMMERLRDPAITEMSRTEDVYGWGACNVY